MYPTNSPKVSVCMLAYNQREYFRACIESTVSQNTTFPFEIIVCDDASTDGTAEVLRDYAARYPDLIRPIYREKNVGHYVNYVEAHNLARGTYVAHMDGDDLCLPGKLQAQADFLDANTEVSVVWHAVQMIDGEGHHVGRACIRDAIAPDGYLSIEDALEIGSIGTHSATMYRAAARTTRAPSMKAIDWFYAVEFLSHGKGYQLAEELGVYRKLVGISMSSNNASVKRVRRNFAAMMNYYIKLFPQYRQQIFTQSILLVLCDLRAGNSSFIAMLNPLWASRSLISPGRFMRALRRFRAVSKAFQPFYSSDLGNVSTS